MVSRAKPQNTNTLTLMLSKAELGIVSLGAIFDLGDYSKIENIVKNTLSTINNVRDQLEG